MSLYPIITKDLVARHLAFAHQCFGCGQQIESAAVGYDGFGEGQGGTILLHPKCANEMAQRLIIDSWPNRRLDPDYAKAQPATSAGIEEFEIPAWVRHKPTDK